MSSLSYNQKSALIYIKHDIGSLIISHDVSKYDGLKLRRLEEITVKACSNPSKTHFRDIGLPNIDKTIKKIVGSDEREQGKLYKYANGIMKCYGNWRMLQN